MSDKKKTPKAQALADITTECKKGTWEINYIYQEQKIKEFINVDFQYIRL